MPSQDRQNPTTLELTESETQLRDLLLGVAAYIDDGPTIKDENVSSIEVPGDLAKEKVVLRWTGGWVRDKLLGVGSHDVDVAINKMTGENFGLKMLEYLKLPGNIEKHKLDKQESGRIVSGLHTIKANPEASKNLATATINIMGIDLDLVNLRKETYNEVSRNPEMEFGTAEEDAMRRDATVNAMFYNLHTQRIEDFTKRGFEDMAAKIIRTPLEPYQTFKDDPLRVLRLVRFASRLDYIIDPKTAAAMSDKEIQETLKIKIKRERVGIELEKMLKGPDPHMAVALIHKFGLYTTIFTDPTREMPTTPDIEYFVSAYDFVNSVQSESQDSTSTIAHTLLRDADEWYLAWICAAVMPWADAPQIPHPKPLRLPYHAAYLVAQEGFKAPNKVCDVIAAALNHGDEIKKVVEQCQKELRRGQSAHGDAAARDTLGMAIRRWGSTWRSQVFFSLVYEVVLGSVSKEAILRQYTDFLTHLSKEKLLDADTFKPLVNGKDLAKAMSIKPGPWMKDALDVVMAWQLRNPEATDPAQAIEEVKRAQGSNSELPSRLITHFLSLTIPPFFPQTSSGNSEPKPWKDPKSAYFLDLLKWILSHSRPEDVRKNMHLLRPPIMEMLLDTDLAWRAQACELVALLIRAAPSDFLKQQGYDKLFSTELFPFFTYLPTITPEEETVVLLQQVYPALTALCVAIGRDEKGFDRLVREGILAPLAHITPSTYPKLATLIMSQLSILLDELHISSVKHLPSTLPLLATILQDRFAPSHPPLLIATAKALERTIANGWPRIGPVRAIEMYAWVCKAWLSCREYDTNLDSVRAELKQVVLMLNSLLAEEETWIAEKKRIRADGSVLVGLFDDI